MLPVSPTFSIRLLTPKTPRVLFPATSVDPVRFFRRSSRQSDRPTRRPLGPLPKRSRKAPLCPWISPVSNGSESPMRSRRRLSQDQTRQVSVSDSAKAETASILHRELTPPRHKRILQRLTLNRRPGGREHRQRSSPPAARKNRRSTGN